MRRLLPWFGLGLFLVGGASGTFACGSDSSSGSGGSAGTVLEGGSPGGTGGSGGDGGTGGGGAAGSGGTGGGTLTDLGRACETDDTCGPGLRCVTAASGLLTSGGPARGYCTAECGTDGGTDCTEFAPDAICLNFGDELNAALYCVQACTFGPADQADFSADKCHGRQEVACAPLFRPTGTLCTTDAQCGTEEICGDTECFEVVPACLPQCNSDADCAGDLFCDPSDGLCRTAEKTGLTLGAQCTPPSDGGADECRGNCTSFVAGTGGEPLTSMCAENCTNGALPSCGWNGPSAGKATAFCLFASTVIFDRGGPGVGDRGSCGQLCNCDTECSNPDLICRDFGNEAFQRALQQRGYCALAQNEDGGLDPGIPCTGDGG